jgi:hypothetical protein
MENKNSFDLRAIAKKFFSVDTTLTGPHEASNQKMYMKASFEMNTEDDDGYISQSKAYVKCFFEDSHSLIYIKAQKLMEDNLPLKIMAAKVVIPTDRKFYILDSENKKQKNADGNYRMSSSITLFVLADENVITLYNQQVNSITRHNAWVAEAEPDEDDQTGDEKEVKATGKKK